MQTKKINRIGSVMGEKFALIFTTTLQTAVDVQINVQVMSLPIMLIVYGTTCCGYNHLGQRTFRRKPSTEYTTDNTPKVDMMFPIVLKFEMFLFVLV